MWQIEQMTRTAASGGVVTAYWRVTAQDGEHAAANYGGASFTPNPEADDFIPFENLTQDIVLEWVFQQINKADIESHLEQQLEHMKHPTELSGVPWVTVDVHQPSAPINNPEDLQETP